MEIEEEKKKEEEKMEVDQEKGEEKDPQEDSSSSSSSVVEEKKEKDWERFSFNIISFTQTTRLQNGLRHSLYQRYRHYCNRRILRLRRNLNLRQVNTTGKGAGRRFNRNPVHVHQVKDSRYFLVPLMEAERSWSYGMELRENYETDQNHRTRNHSIRKFCKAASSAEHLLKLCKARGDGRTALEAEAYFLQLKGFWLMERKDYAQALGCYPQAKLIFEQLSRVVVDNDDQKTIQSRILEIETAIKFCDSRKHLSRSVGEEEEEEEESPEKELQEKFEKMLLEEQTKSSGTLSEFSWKGATVPLPTGKIRVAFLDIRSILDQIRKEKDVGALLGFYDNLFLRYNDVIEFIRDSQKQQMEKGNVKSVKSTARQKNMELLREYAQFHRQLHTLNRNVLLLHGARIRYHSPDKPFGVPEVAEKLPLDSWEQHCGISASGLTSKKILPEELVKLCDNILANVKDLEANCDEKDTEEKENYVAVNLYYTALRCYYVSLSFARNERFAEAQALLLRTENYASSSSDHFAVCQTKTKSDLLCLEALTNQIRVQKCLLKAKYIQSKGKKEKEKEKEEEGVEEEKEERNEKNVGEFSLWDYSGDQKGDKIFTFPPDFHGLHCNPLLFDLAMDEISVPSLEARKTPARRGLFAWW
eukprot:CAMPEP_0201477976 /NCGR_PEP_ID=MMETSP0151_2-20130828/2908_1 /ASSEMBLY_ACC=CAM_ASM_000257 /TAXON_ID=200890 /ORGANISM="Paramoeba atlantica, Strain 621/1 / CCAP 1560/9" /LENGTH=643 /DNA_ID=CAMNT_0047858883 /DNA_START=6 /DNA_END=1937 /DNA_ORIENTATION=+